jgi:hypothetical protein
MAAFLAAVATALVAALIAFLAKLCNLDAIVQMFNGVTQTQYKSLENRVVALERRPPS